MSIFTRAFAKAAVERAVKTAAQSALLVLGAEQINALVVGWEDVAGFALGGFVLSALTSIASAKAGPAGPSLTNEVLSPPAPYVEDEEVH